VFLVELLIAQPFASSGHFGEFASWIYNRAILGEMMNCWIAVVGAVVVVRAAPAHRTDAYASLQPHGWVAGDDGRSSPPPTKTQQRRRREEWRDSACPLNEFGPGEGKVFAGAAVAIDSVQTWAGTSVAAIHSSWENLSECEEAAARFPPTNHTAPIGTSPAPIGTTCTAACVNNPALNASFTCALSNSGKTVGVAIWEGTLKCPTAVGLECRQNGKECGDESTVWRHPRE
jgi:hypothetical protein